MANFHSQFQSYFSSEEKESEIYKIISTIGVNVEKTILEEIDTEMRRAVEASVFPERKLRSWLAAFLMPVRNSISARGQGTIVLSSGGSVTIPIGSVLIGKNGKEYELQETLTLSGAGSSLPFSFIQGSTVTTQPLTYTEFLSVPIKTGNVDLSDLRVFFSDGTEIPVVSSFPEIPYPDTFSLKTLLDGVADGSLDINDVNEDILENIASINGVWGAIQSVSIRPKGGYFPFFFNDVLYIKVYPDIEQGVPVPDGRTVQIRYRLSDGVAGNLPKDSFLSFSDSLKMVDGTVAGYQLYNKPVFNGVNPPSHAELVNMFRRRFFSSTHVSSIPEYTIWFLSQPEVGDCHVVSDYYKWRLSDRTDFSGADITGTVEIYLLNNDGGLITPDNPIVKELDDRLLPVRDIAFLDYKLPRVFWHFYIVQFRSVFDEMSFTGYAESSLQRLYSIDTAKALDTSLFKDLDMSVVDRFVRGNHDPLGLRVIPLHYYESVYNLGVSSTSFLEIMCYRGQKPGGWYEYYEYHEDLGFGRYDEGAFIVGEPRAVFKEFLGVAGGCSIYQYEKRHNYVDGEYSGFTWGALAGDTSTAYVGDRFVGSGLVRFDMSRVGNVQPGVMRCFWLIEKDGVMPVGSEPSRNFGIRKLPTGGKVVGDENTEVTFFPERVRFEKYI